MYDVIRRPLVTEKNTVQNEVGIYVFEVDTRADKAEIKKAVEKAFKVKVVGVRTALCRNRSRRVGKTLAPTKYWKKAFVRLKSGEKIKLFEGA
jgi:large subunit ribosomal protein L23